MAAWRSVIRIDSIPIRGVGWLPKFIGPPDRFCRISTDSKFVTQSQFQALLPSTYPVYTESRGIVPRAARIEDSGRRMAILCFVGSE